MEKKLLNGFMIVTFYVEIFLKMHASLMLRFTDIILQIAVFCKHSRENFGLLKYRAFMITLFVFAQRYFTLYVICYVTGTVNKSIGYFLLVHKRCIFKS